jgi:hypothetical protein
MAEINRRWAWRVARSAAGFQCRRGPRRLSGFPPAGNGESRAYPPGVRVHGLWPGFLAVLLLLCIGVGLVSAALPDDADDYGYYDGDGDDAVAAPERLAVLVDLVVRARGETTPIRTSEAFDGPTVVAPRPIVQQSPAPLLRSPPTA